jgi:hypothetical protein
MRSRKRRQGAALNRPVVLALKRQIEVVHFGLKGLRFFKRRVVDNIFSSMLRMLNWVGSWD